jgi:hypothetical protein
MGLVTQDAVWSGAVLPWAILGSIGISWNMVEFVGKTDKLFEIIDRYENLMN